MADELKDEHGYKLDTYTDFRKLLERKDIDAVSIATPNHTHALIAVAAAQAGKHVYVEKPVSHNIWEGRQMVQAARQNNRLMQCGTQSRSSRASRMPSPSSAGGELGKIKYALGTCYKPRLSIGKLDKPLADSRARSTTTSGADRPRRRTSTANSVHYDWHWDYNTGNGDMGNQGIHQMDIARWFLGEDAARPAGDQHRRPARLRRRRQHAQHADRLSSTTRAAPLIFETRGLPRSKRSPAALGRQHGPLPRLADRRHRAMRTRLRARPQLHRGHSPTTTTARRSSAGASPTTRSATTSRTSSRRSPQTIRRSSTPTSTKATSRARSATSAASPISSASRSAPARLPSKSKATSCSSTSFDRMASHLRANGVDIDRESEAPHPRPVARTRSRHRRVHRQRRRHGAPLAQATRALRGPRPRTQRGRQDGLNRAQNREARPLAGGLVPPRSWLGSARSAPTEIPPSTSSVCPVM